MKTTASNIIHDITGIEAAAPETAPLADLYSFRVSHNEIFGIAQGAKKYVTYFFLKLFLLYPKGLSQVGLSAHQI